MKKSIRWKTIVWTQVMALQCCPLRAGYDPAVSAAASSVMSVTGSLGGTGGVVLVVQENHASRLGQVEEALFLGRAYGDPQLNLRDIAVEGYLKDRSRVPFAELHRTGEFKDRLDVAVGRLERGEIYSGEFMAMVFPDVKLVSTENAAEHEITAPTNAQRSVAAAETLMKLKTISPEDQALAELIINEFRKATNADSKRDLAKKLDEVTARSPLAKKWASAESAHRDGLSIEADIARLEDVRSEGTRLGIGTINANQALKEYEAYLRTRSAASLTMASSVLAYRSQGTSGVVAMVIGAGHTASVTNQLRKAGRSFVVLTPVSFHSTDDHSMDPDAYRRNLGQDRAPQGSLEAELEQLLSESHHPQPPTRRPVERAETEIYQLATTLARGSGGPPVPPSGPPTLTPGFWDPGQWKREFVTLDVGSIYWLDRDGKKMPAISPADWDSERGQPKNAGAVVFDILIRRPDGTSDRWTVKARASEVEGMRTDRRRFKEDISEQMKEVEKTLQKARERLRDGKDIYTNRKADVPDPQHSGVYRLKPTTDVEMIIGKDPGKVAQMQFEG